MYFKDEYVDYYDALVIGENSMQNAVVGLQDSITEVSNQFNSITLLLGEMSGSFSSEITSGIVSLLDEIKGLKKIIDYELPMAVNNMNDLGTKLGQLKPEDDKYEEKKEEYDLESGRQINQYEINQEGIKIEREEYKNWINNLAELKTTIDELIQICVPLQKKCDIDINLINKFNEKVVDFRLKLVAVATSTGNTTIQDISKMTVEEKKKYLEALINDITAKYNKYKELYDYYSKGFINENCSNYQLFDFTDFYSELLGDIKGAPKVHTALDSKNPVTRGNAIVDIINYLGDSQNGVNGKSILDIISLYSNGTSWSESGMDEIYHRSNNNSVIDAIRNNDPERLFWSRVTGGSSEYNEEIINNFLHVTNVLKESEKGFLENYNKALGSAMVIKGVKGLNNCLVYDDIYKSQEFKEYSPNEVLLIQNGFIDNNYTLDEQKMLSYLIEKDGYDSAKMFSDLRQDAINRRNGQINAEKYYDYIHNGNNEGLDAIIDHVNVGGKGFVDGVETFADGLIDIIAPDKQMSAKDYETMFFLNKLKNSKDEYDDSLLTDYRICNTIGKYALPTVLGAVTGGGVGSVAFIASDIGNGIEENQQQSFASVSSYDSLILEQENYLESLYKSAVPYVSSDLPTDAITTIAGIFADIDPFTGAALDFVLDVGRAMINDHEQM